MLHRSNRPAMFLRTLIALTFFAWQATRSDGLAVETAKTVASATFSAGRGFFDNPFNVELTTRTPGAKIYFTTDGAPPTERTGSLYTAPIKIPTTTILRAAAFKQGLESSGTETQTYLFLKDV